LTVRVGYQTLYWKKGKEDIIWGKRPIWATESTHDPKSLWGREKNIQHMGTRKTSAKQEPDNGPSKKTTIETKKKKLQKN